MVCCAICGLIKLNQQCKHFRKINIMYNNLNTNEFGCRFYGIANCLLFDNTTTSNGKDMCVCVCVFSKCYIEQNASTYVKYGFVNKLIFSYSKLIFTF